MKIKKGFIIRKVADQFVAVATGEASEEFNQIIRLNDEAAFAFELLHEDTTEEELVASLVEKYNANEAEIKADVKYFLAKLKEADALE